MERRNATNATPPSKVRCLKKCAATQRRRTPGPSGGGLQCIGPYEEINESRSTGRHCFGANKRIGEKTFPPESRVVRSQTRGMCIVQMKASENDAVVALCALESRSF